MIMSKELEQSSRRSEAAALMRKALLTSLTNMQGPCKGTDLVCRAVDLLYNDWRRGAAVSIDGSSQDLLDVLDELVAEGEIIEISYVLPSMDYREKSIY